MAIIRTLKIAVPKEKKIVEAEEMELQEIIFCNLMAEILYEDFKTNINNECSILSKAIGQG